MPYIKTDIEEALSDFSGQLPDLRLDLKGEELASIGMDPVFFPDEEEEGETLSVETMRYLNLFQTKASIEKLKREIARRRPWRCKSCWLQYKDRDEALMCCRPDLRQRKTSKVTKQQWDEIANLAFKGYTLQEIFNQLNIHNAVILGVYAEYRNEVQRKLRINESGWLKWRQGQREKYGLPQASPGEPTTER